MKNTKLDERNHLPGAQNPVDLGTRGKRANEIATRVWLNGSAWLRENEAQMPKATTQRHIVEDKLEITQVVASLPNKPLEIQWEQFRSWTKLVHAICYASLENLNQLKGPISLDE